MRAGHPARSEKCVRQAHQVEVLTPRRFDPARAKPSSAAAPRKALPLEPDDRPRIRREEG